MGIHATQQLTKRHSLWECLLVYQMWLRFALKGSFVIQSFKDLVDLLYNPAKVPGTKLRYLRMRETARAPAREALGYNFFVVMSVHVNMEMIDGNNTREIMEIIPAP